MRELYVGNLPPGMLAPQLQEFLGAAIQQLNLNTTPGNPIINAWLSGDGHYAFVEFRTVEETDATLQMNGSVRHLSLSLSFSPLVRVCVHLLCLTSLFARWMHAHGCGVDVGARRQIPRAPDGRPLRKSGRAQARQSSAARDRRGARTNADGTMGL